MPDPEASNYRRRADWVLLDKVAYIADRPNGTTAQGFTHTGQAIQVSFWLADPPDLSHLCIHCPGLKALDFAAEPTIVCSEKDIAIFQIHFNKGILCCQVDDKSPLLPLRLIRYVAPPMPINKGMFDCASGIRDVICINGVIKFIEIANRKKLVLCEQSDDLSHNNGVLHDSDLDELTNNMFDAKDVYAYDGWVVVTWNRQVSSDRWLRDCQVDVNDVIVSNPRHLDLLPHLSSSYSGKLILNKNLLMSAPTFGLQDGDVVYLMCKLEIMDKAAWVLAINTREKALEDLAFYTDRTCCFYRTYCHLIIVFVAESKVMMLKRFRLAQLYLCTG